MKKTLYGRARFRLWCFLVSAHVHWVRPRLLRLGIDAYPRRLANNYDKPGYQV